MIQAVVCAENPITRAGLVAMVATTAVAGVGQVETPAALDQWLKIEAADGGIDLALVECPVLTLATARTLSQIVGGWSAPAMLLLVDDGAVSVGEQRRWLQLFSLGTVSLLPLTVSAMQVRGAIATIATGLTVLHPDLAEALFASAPGNIGALPDLPQEPLSPREIEVLNQLAAGSSNKTIAKALGISEHTVKFHISTLLAKLGVASRTEAVSVGIRAGLILL